MFFFHKHTDLLSWNCVAECYDECYLLLFNLGGRKPTMYDLRRKNRQNSKTGRKPWLTKGLEKACKNRLYREKEDKYKTQKQKLKSIMRLKKRLIMIIWYNTIKMHEHSLESSK